MTAKNPLIARFVGAAAAAFVAAESQTQFESCLHEAHQVMQHPAYLEAVASQVNAGPADFWAFDPNSYMASLRPYVVVDGILQIPVKGVLLHDLPYALGSWATGYAYIWEAFKRGMADPAVKGIALVCDSPGGQVAGNFELVDKMWALKGSKPIRGFASECAYSAAYSIISVSDVIYVTRTGGVGSIGVVTSHVDTSKADAKYGLKFTFIYAGQHKVDGNQHEPLPADVKGRIQKRIDALYAVFVSTVARNRGMEEQAVRDTEALTFTAEDALSIGLADKIGSLDDSLAAYAADLSPDEGDESMSTPQGTVEQAVHEAAVASARAEGLATGITQGTAAGLKDGASAERTRISAILASAEGKERPVAALAAATDTELSVEAAATFLAKMPKETAVAAVAPANGFLAAMETGDNAALLASGHAAADAVVNADSPDTVLAAAAAFGIPGMRAPAKQ
jgi:signal peptide peptidase SppA